MAIRITTGRYPGPTSNAERQRQFRRRNPNYYKQYRARQKAATEASLAALRLAAAQAAAAVSLSTPAPSIPEGVWITLPALVPVPVEAAQPAAAALRVMRVVEG